MTTTAASQGDVPGETAVEGSPGKEIVREIARGGLAGVIVGVVVIGLGGRLVMRLATIVQEQAVGGTTDNGNRIGDITAGGTLALVTVGMFVGAMAATVWVIATPWLPRGGVRRAVVAVPLAIAVGTSGLIEGNTGDFIQLRHDPVIVALLVALVGLVGLALSVVDDFLEHRLPHPRMDHPGVTWFYSIVVGIGAVVVFPIVLASYFQSQRAGVAYIGMALVLVGLATLVWWIQRLDGRTHPPTILVTIGRTGLVIAAILGIAAAIPGINGALGR